MYEYHSTCRRFSWVCPPFLSRIRSPYYADLLNDVALLACLSARSGSLDEITGSLYTLVATNVAMAVTAFILGFKNNAEITLQECVPSHQPLFLYHIKVI